MSSPPSTLGKYQIIREIARSNDIVYEAYDPGMNRRVALKELAQIGGSTPQQRDDRIKRFMREARAAGSMVHPNIVTVYEIGEFEGRHFIAMEYLDGHNLRNEIDSKGFVAPERALEIMMGVAQALEFAHSKGVIHRDIKPDNIQLLSDGRIKITDFGIARLTFEPNLTMDGQVFGTPSYMSPEQVVGKDIDARTDLFSMGIVLYEMLTGQKPFTGDNVVAITYAIMNNPPQRPSHLHTKLWDVISWLLEKSPPMRPHSASEVYQLLREAKNALAEPPPVPSYQYTMPTAPTIQPPPIQHQPTSTPIYTYNPYLSQYPPVQSQTQNPFGASPPNAPFATPIYIPPPKRGPTLSDGTRDFLRRLGIVFAAMSILAFGTIYAVKYFGETVPRSGWYVAPHEAQGGPPGSGAMNPTPRAALDATAEHHLAAARRYADEARTAADPSRAMGFLRESSLHWAAIDQRTEPGALPTDIGVEAAEVLFTYATRLTERRNYAEARTQLYLARRFAPPGTQIAELIEQALQSLT